MLWRRGYFVLHLREPYSILSTCFFVSHNEKICDPGRGFDCLARWRLRLMGYGWAVWPV